MDIPKWLSEPPHELDLIKMSNGIWIIPYDVVEAHLDFLCECNWSTYNFEHKYCIINGVEAISASVILEVNYFGICRKLSGACTYPLAYLKDLSNIISGTIGTESANEHYASTALSLCIVRAARVLGPRFGRDLNKPKKQKENYFTKK